MGVLGSQDVVRSKAGWTAVYSNVYILSVMCIYIIIYTHYRYVIYALRPTHYTQNTRIIHNTHISCTFHVYTHQLYL